jgi:GNAT superfamily N-acetyltransferase
MRAVELVHAAPTPDEIQDLEDRIYEFNSAVTGIADGDFLAIFARDSEQRTIGGICGNTWGGCFEIRQFWVAPAWRKQGLGTELYLAAEREARQRGCRQVVLMTFTFQAPGFYAKHGFEVLAVLEDHPHGHSNLLLRKQLSQTGRC